MARGKDKDGEGATGTLCDARQQTRDLSWERQAATAWLIADALVRNTIKLTAKLTALLNERLAASMPTTLNTSSGTARISAMPPFDWTRDKTICQWWQVWSKKARHALNVMEGDSNEAKISYLHHWIDSAGEAKVESWINNGTLLKKEDFEKLSQDEKKGKFSQSDIESYFQTFESMLTPKSNPLLAVKEIDIMKQGSMTAGEFHAQITKTVKRHNFPNEGAEERAIRDVLSMEHDHYPCKGQGHKPNE